MNEPRLTHPLDAPESATPGVGFLWHPASALPCLTASAELQSWALERGSLTRRLRQHWPDTRVQVLSEALTPPLPHEAQALGLATGEAAWVRCVCLIGGDQARIYARTVIPRWHAQNPWAEVQRQGIRCCRLCRVAPVIWDHPSPDGHTGRGVATVGLQMGVWQGHPQSRPATARPTPSFPVRVSWFFPPGCIVWLPVSHRTQRPGWVPAVAGWSSPSL